MQHRHLTHSNFTLSNDLVIQIPTTHSEIGAAIAQELALRENITTAYLYGSAARDRLRPDSDVDVAVAGVRPLLLDETLTISRQLSEVLRREVDLVDLRVVEGLILREILTRGTPLVVRDKVLMVTLAKKVVYFSEDFLPLTVRMRNSRIERLIHAQ